MIDNNRWQSTTINQWPKSLGFLIGIDWYRLSSIIIDCHQIFLEGQNNKYQLESGMNNKQRKKLGKSLGKMIQLTPEFHFLKAWAVLLHVNPFGGDPVDHNYASYGLLLVHFHNLLSSSEQRITRKLQQQMGFMVPFDCNSLTHVSSLFVSKLGKSPNTYATMSRTKLPVFDRKQIGLTSNNSQW